MDTVIIFSNIGIGLCYIVLATKRIWDVSTPTTWSFRLFVGFCGLTYLLDATLYLVPSYEFIAAMMHLLTLTVSWTALVMVSYHQEEIFAVHRPIKGVRNADNVSHAE